jgi:hypothetical protein
MANLFSTVLGLLSRFIRLIIALIPLGLFAVWLQTYDLLILVSMRVSFMARAILTEAYNDLVYEHFHAQPSQRKGCASWPSGASRHLAEIHCSHPGP